MKAKNFLLFFSLLLLFFFFLALPASAQPLQLPDVELNINGGGDAQSPQDVVGALQILALLTVLSVAPAFLIMITSFTRIIVVLSFVRNALATQQTPPNQVLIGLALFLTFFIMAPVYQDINTEAIQPYLNETINQEEAWQKAQVPLRDFLLKQTREKDLALFINISGEAPPAAPEEVSLTTLIPAFAISELKTAFTMGFMIYLPFLIIDIVVASILMSMGMFMLPPIIISLPFKLLLFVLVDGWYLVIKSLLESFAF